MNQLGTKPRNVRDNNYRLLINLYRTSSPISVSELAKQAHLSRTTVNIINESLLEKRIILPQGKGDSTGEGGKKPNIYTLNPEYGYVLCFHIKYERVYMRVFNMLLETVHKEEEAIPRDAPLQVVLPLLGRFFKSCLEFTHDRLPIAVVMAVHGTVDCARGTLFNAIYFPSWGLNTALVDLFKLEIGHELPVYLDNWINFKTYAAKEMGISKNLSSFILIDAGYHGVVAGVFYNNRPYVGQHYLAGEIGHMVISPDDAELCQCGGRGCLESLIKTSRITAQAASLRSEYPDSQLFSESDEPTLEMIIAGFLDEDPLAVHLMDGVARWLAIGLSNLNLLIDPQLIILEGEYATAGPGFLSMIKEKFYNVSMIRNSNRAEIVLNEAHSFATLLGAASFAVGHHLEALNSTL